MTKFSLISVGVLIGAAATYALTSLGDILDEGISRTYGCDQMAREDDARRSAEKIIQQFLIGKPLTDLEAITAAAGLQMQKYDKFDYIEIVVGHSPGTAALNFEAARDGKLSTRSIPGSIPCKTLEGDGH
ncbi:MAG: hypothetical protein GJ677_08660 [Rhodobacteraceae bacterium]|nr:hypothetical protein [Paracoccaceae bacterium]